MGKIYASMVDCLRRTLWFQEGLYELCCRSCGCRIFISCVNPNEVVFSVVPFVPSETSEPSVNSTSVQPRRWGRLVLSINLARISTTGLFNPSDTQSCG